MESGEDTRTRKVWSLQFSSFKNLGSAFVNFQSTIRQIFFVGNYSLVIILVSGLFVGFVLGLQGDYVLSTYGSEQALGVLVALSLLRRAWPGGHRIAVCRTGRNFFDGRNWFDECGRTAFRHGNDGRRSR